MDERWSEPHPTLEQHGGVTVAREPRPGALELGP
jgi:hypothetical protein